MVVDSHSLADDAAPVRWPPLMALVWLGGGLVATGFVGSGLALNALARLKPQAFDDATAKRQLKIVMFFIVVMLMGAGLAVIHAPALHALMDGASVLIGVLLPLAGA